MPITTQIKLRTGDVYLTNIGGYFQEQTIERVVCKGKAIKLSGAGWVDTKKFLDTSKGKTGHYESRRFLLFWNKRVFVKSED